MIKNILVLFLICFFYTTTVAQESQESKSEEKATTKTVNWNKIYYSTSLEFSFNSKEEPYLSNYLWVDNNNFCAYTRFNFTKLEKNFSISRGEFAVGLPFYINKTTKIKTYLGVTNEAQILTYSSIISTFKGRYFIYSIDGKIATKQNTNSELNQNLAFFLDRGNLLKVGNTLKFKIDYLRSANKNQFFRIGLEKAKWISNRTQIYGAAYFDPIQNNFGISTGVRISLN